MAISMIRKSFECLILMINLNPAGFVLDLQSKIQIVIFGAPSEHFQSQQYHPPTLKLAQPIRIFRKEALTLIC